MHVQKHTFSYFVFMCRKYKTCNLGGVAAKTNLVGHFDDCWCPFVKLIHPVWKSSVSERQFTCHSKLLHDLMLKNNKDKIKSLSSREGYNDEVGSIETFVLHEVCDEGDSLDGFSQTHLVRQDPVQIVVVEGNKPLQTFNLSGKFMWGRKSVKHDKYFLQLISPVSHNIQTFLCAGRGRSDCAFLPDTVWVVHLSTN